MNVDRRRLVALGIFVALVVWSGIAGWEAVFTVGRCLGVMTACTEPWGWSITWAIGAAGAACYWYVRVVR